MIPISNIAINGYYIIVEIGNHHGKYYFMINCSTLQNTMSTCNDRKKPWLQNTPLL